jgi:hypothetical protein
MRTKRIEPEQRPAAAIEGQVLSAGWGRTKALNEKTDPTVLRLTAMQADCRMDSGRIVRRCGE